MTDLTATQIAERENARRDNGEFGTHEHSTPDVSLGSKLTPKQLGLLGLGPSSPNIFADSFDAGDADRPLRPYLPLTSGDDDEVFDAPIGTRILVVTDEQNMAVRKFERDSDDTWRELSEHREVATAEVTTGEVWEALFADDGKMHSAQLSAPLGALYSDRTYFVRRDAVDAPLSVEEARDRLRAHPRAFLVSHSSFGDSRDDGVPQALRGKLKVDVADDGYLHLAAPGRGRQASRGINLTALQLFDRDGDIVLRRETDPGFGWEDVLRPTR